MSNTSFGAAFHTSRRVHARMSLNPWNITKCWRLVTEGKITGVLHFDSKAIVEEYIGSLGIPATFVHLSVFMSYLLFFLKPTNPGSKSYKFSVPFPTNIKLPMISVNEDTGKYAKAILLNREKVLGKQVLVGEKDYSPDDIVRIMRDVGGLDVVSEEITHGEYRKSLAMRGVPDFFIDDMSDNMRYIQTYGFFNGKSLDGGHEVSRSRLQVINCLLSWIPCLLGNSWLENPWRLLRSGLARAGTLLL